MLPLLGLVAGLCVGSKLNLNNEVILGAGLLVSAAIPVIGATPLCIGLGIGIAGIVRNIIADKYKSKIEELSNLDEIDVNGTETTQEFTHNEATESAKTGYWCLCSTLAFTAIPLQLLTIIKGLSSVLMPISIIKVVGKGYREVVENPKRGIEKGILTIGVGCAGIIAISNVGSGGMLTYFLGLISIPRLVLNKKREGESNKNRKEKIYDEYNFLYGGESNNASIIGTGIVLGQTILWGSGKDVLGTIVNGDLSVVLDPVRLSMLAAVVGWLYWTGKSGYIEKVTKELESKSNKGKNNNNNNILQNAIKIASMGYCLMTYSPILVGSMLLGGLVLNALDRYEVVRNTSIPMLLIIGLLNSF